MLKKLTERLNKDANKEFESRIFTESIDTCDQLLEDVSENELDILKEAFEYTELDDSLPVEENVDRLAESANDPIKTINEAVVSTSTMIQIDKDSYDELIATITLYTKESTDEDDKKVALKKIKNYIKNLNRVMRKVNDDRPADALTTSAVNKLCKAFDVEIEKDEKNTAKYNMAIKLNALSKAIR